MGLFPSTNVERLARDKGGLVGGEKSRGGRGIPWCTHSSQGHSFCDLGAVDFCCHPSQGRKILALCFAHRGRNMIRANGIDADSLRREINRRSARQSDHAVL